MFNIIVFILLLSGQVAFSANSTIPGIGGNSIPIRSYVTGYESPGNGSTNTAVLRWSNLTTVGTDITATDSATLGTSFTVNSDGIYTVGGTGPWSSSCAFGVTINGNALTTGYNSLTFANGLRGEGSFISSGAPCNGGFTGFLTSGSIIRIQNDSDKGSFTDDRAQVSVIKVNN